MSAGMGIGGTSMGIGMSSEKVERFNEMPSSIKNPKPPSRGNGIFGKPPMVSNYKPMSK